MSELPHIIGQLEREIRELQEGVGKRDRRIAALEDSAQEQDTRLKAQEKSIDLLATMIADLSKRSVELEGRVAALEVIVENLGEVTEFLIIQQGDDMANSITGIVVGQKGSFSALNVPAGSIIPPGKTPTWASDNPLAVVSQAADGLSCVVTVDPTATGSFNLSVFVTRTDGAVASGSAAVPFLPAPPPPPVEVSSFDINQTA